VIVYDRQNANHKGFSSSSRRKDIMSVRRFFAPFLCTLFGLYGIIWGLVASSSLIATRIGGAFLGVLFLLLAFVYVRMVLPQEQADSSHSSTT
jgi:hypothetical protein